MEIVKRIAKEPPETDVEQALDEIAHPQERWRKIAKQVQQEQDPNRLMELVTQLLKEFDESKIPRKETRQQ